ncbi:MAG: DUF2029 domain-containing protein, partial [Rubrobacter sp.]|nr:DUF2029 domain-containing protein [Rubrobacter sp.]
MVKLAAEALGDLHTLRRYRQVSLFLLLLPLLLATFGFESGAQTGSEEMETYPNLSETDATNLALRDPDVREELTKHGPYTSDAEYKDGEWTVHFTVDEGGPAGGKLLGNGKKEVAQVGEDDQTQQLKYVWTGDQVGWDMARGDTDSYGRLANYWYVWEPQALIFVLAFMSYHKLFSLRTLDVIVLVSFIASHGFFRTGESSYWAVLLWYVPLLYLLGRTLLMGFGIGQRVEKTSSFPTPVLFVLGALASGFVLIGNFVYSSVLDVGYAGVVGANLLMRGMLPYGNGSMDIHHLYPQSGNLATYGPMNYLLYVPFVWLFGWSGEWDYVLAAHVMTAFAFVVGALAMLLAGRRYAGTKGGAALLFAWAVFPYTFYSTNNNTNDVIIAAVAAIGLATAGSPVARGASVAAGFAIKLFPIALAPLWMFHDAHQKRTAILKFVLGGA